MQLKKSDETTFQCIGQPSACPKLLSDRTLTILEKDKENFWQLQAVALNIKRRVEQKVFTE